MKDGHYIAGLTLDEKSIASPTRQLEHERQVAMHDIVEWNHFAVKDAKGPYTVTLSAAEGRVNFAVEPAEGEPRNLPIPLSPLKSVIRDYFLICESYFEAVKGGNLPKIEAIDMSRRALHNEGSETLSTLLADRVSMDTETARRLFTLICVLHMK